MSASYLCVDLCARIGRPWETKRLDSRGSMVAKLKLKVIDGRKPPGVEPVA